MMVSKIYKVAYRCGMWKCMYTFMRKDARITWEGPIYFNRCLIITQLLVCITILMINDL